MLADMLRSVPIIGLSAPARQFLGTHGWLSNVPTDLREAIFAIGQLREVRAGETFNIAGDTEVGIWGVVSGQVAITSAINNADARIALLGNSGHWGGIGPLFGQPRNANVAALLPSVIMEVPYNALRRILNATPAWWEHMGMLAHEQMLRYGQMVGDLMLPDARARMAAILLHQADLRNRGEGPVSLALTQEELGAMANLSRQPAGALLRDFEALGMIRHSYRQIAVLQPQALRAIADGS